MINCFRKDKFTMHSFKEDYNILTKSYIVAIFKTPWNSESDIQHRAYFACRKNGLGH